MVDTYHKNADVTRVIADVRQPVSDLAEDDAEEEGIDDAAARVSSSESSARKLLRWLSCDDRQTPDRS